MGIAFHFGYAVFYANVYENRIFNITMSNYINNRIETDTPSQTGLFGCSLTELTVELCCFFGNKFEPIFLFADSIQLRGNNVIRNCYIDEFTSFCIECQSICNTTFSYAIHYMSTQKCEAEFVLGDSIERLTALNTYIRCQLLFQSKIYCTIHS